MDDSKVVRPTVFCLMGPTASGKTRLAMSLSERLPISIISVDSAMVYRGLDVGTGKPSAEELRKFPHALVDIRDPFVPYSAGDFLNDVSIAIEKALAAGRLPFLVGGTLLYFRVLQQGLDPLPVRDDAFRETLKLEAQSLGWPALHRRLVEVAPLRAQAIHPHDGQRIQRALEIQKGMAQRVETAQRLMKPYSFCNLALVPEDRSVLHKRIAERLDVMLRQGFLEEVDGLKTHPHFDPEAPSMRSVGYRQILEHSDSALDSKLLRDKILFATRQLAKRQLTWLRSWKELTAFPMESSRCVKDLTAAIEKES